MVCDHQQRHILAERRRLQLTAYANKLPRLSAGGGDRAIYRSALAEAVVADERSGRTDLNVRRRWRRPWSFDVDVVTAAILNDYFCLSHYYYYHYYFNIIVQFVT